MSSRTAPAVPVDRLKRVLADLEGRLVHSQPDVTVRIDAAGGQLTIFTAAADATAEPAVEAARSGQGAEAGTARSWRWDCNLGESIDIASHRYRADLAGEVIRVVHFNLILNAVHEIGEWLRFDDLVIFPPHLGSGAGVQGNGAVTVDVGYSGHRAGQVPSVADGMAGAAAAELLARRLGQVLPSHGWCRAPGKSVHYSFDGPVITDTTVVDAGRSGAPQVAVWRGRWSQATFDATSSGGDQLAAAAALDVHRAAVTHEVHEIGEFFHLDTQAIFNPHLGADRPAGVDALGADGCGPIQVRLHYDAPPQLL